MEPKDYLMLPKDLTLGLTPTEQADQPNQLVQAKFVTPDHSVEWSVLVAQIKIGDDAGIQHLYRLFSPSVKYHLYRELGPQELADRVHDTFLSIVDALRSGDLRKPGNLIWLIYTEMRRQVTAHIEHAVHNRGRQIDLEKYGAFDGPKDNLEQQTEVSRQTKLMITVLHSLSQADRNILERFYVQQVTLDQICREMLVTETQFRLLKSRVKFKFEEIHRKRSRRTHASHV
jgi:RNA polymerase sigma-70 factor, ECF subfamily